MPETWLSLTGTMAQFTAEYSIQQALENHMAAFEKLKEQIASISFEIKLPGHIIPMIQNASSA